MNSYNVLTFNNQVGIVTDAFLLTKLIKQNISTNVELKFVNESNIEDADIGIWIQNFDINLLNKHKKNIFYLNEEWAGSVELNNLHLFSYVICKSNFSYNLVKDCCNAIFLPFISKDYYDRNIIRDKTYLHFIGRSIQKNTELVLNQNLNITLIDSYNRHRPNSNFNHINSYQSEERIRYLLNSHNTHICCSLYESWGHYLFEGLSTGAEIICSDIPVFREQLDPDLVHFIPTNEKTDVSYLYCSDNINNIYKFRKSFFVDNKYFKEYIENFKPIGKSQERRKLYKYIINKNEQMIREFFLNI